MNQLKAGVFLSYVVLGLHTLVGLLYTPYLLRMLGQSEYGLYSLVASIITYLTVLDLGFGNAIVRYTSKYRAEGKIREQYSMFGLFVILYSFIGLIAFVIGLILSFNVELLFSYSMTIEEISKAKIMMLLLSLNLAITFPFSLFGSIITAYENFIFQKMVQIIRIVLSTITMIVLLYMGYKAIALVVVTTFFNILSLLINYIYCRYKFKIQLIFERPNWTFFKEVFVYSFYILLNAIMDKVYWSSGQIILGIISGTIAVAVYSVAITLQQMYMSFSTAISGVFLPKVTTMVTKKQSAVVISDLFIRTGRFQFIVMSFILTGFILFGRIFIVFWAGKDYEEAYIITLLFFIPLTVPLIQNVGISILQARNQMKFRSIIYVFIAFLSLLISIPLSSKYGAIGCAIGTSLALCIGQIVIMNVYYFKKQDINIPLFWREIFKMSISPFIVGLSSYLFLNIYTIYTIYDLLVCVSLFTVVYGVIFWFTSMKQEEKNIIMAPIKKMLQR